MEYDELHRLIDSTLSPHGITPAPGETLKGPFTGPGWILFDSSSGRPFLMMRQAIPLTQRPEIPKDEYGSATERPLDEAAGLLARMTAINDLLAASGWRTKLWIGPNDTPQVILDLTPQLT